MERPPGFEMREVRDERETILSHDGRRPVERLERILRAERPLLRRRAGMGLIRNMR